MPDRYFSQNAIGQADQAILTDAEAHHLVHVMRAKPGLRVVLFDGSGAEFDAEVSGVGRSDVRLTILQRREIDRELPFLLVLGVSLPKGDRQKWLVEKLVEVGVSALVPLLTTRSVAQPVEQALTRLERTVIEASKQCGRNRLMEISSPRRWPDFVAGAPPSSSRWLAHPGFAERPREVHGSNPTRADRPPVVRERFVAVGPEGGFTEEEVALATAAGWQTMDLGPRILRIETAAITVAVLAVAERVS